MFKKENLSLILVIVGIIVVGTSGYLLWRINQEGSLSSEESDASSKLSCGEYGCKEDSDCSGWNSGNGDYQCNERMDHDASKQRCERFRCPTGYELDDDRCTCNLIDDSCDGGGWTSKPTTVEEGDKVTISGYGEDVSGIDSDSIVIEVDGSEIDSDNVTLSEGTTRTTWSVTASGLSVGSHIVKVSWADTEGNTGNDCELTTTFTVTEVEEEEEDNCVTLWWYDNSSTECQQDEFCDESEYSGLEVFSSESACNNALEEENEEEEDTTVSMTTTTSSTTPQTGILDEPWGKVVLGFAILAVGMLFMRFNIFELDWNGVEINSRSGRFFSRKSKNSMNGFEKKVVKDD